MRLATLVMVVRRVFSDDMQMSFGKELFPSSFFFLSPPIIVLTIAKKRKSLVICLLS